MGGFCREISSMRQTKRQTNGQLKGASLSQADLQAAFFARMGGRQQFQGLFEHLPGVCFFVKDADGRFMAANGLCLRRMGFSSEA
jgi:hypothetical protein